MTEHHSKIDFGLKINQTRLQSKTDQNQILAFKGAIINHHPNLEARKLTVTQYGS